jgi:hypothetical protein
MSANTFEIPVFFFGGCSSVVVGSVVVVAVVAVFFVVAVVAVFVVVVVFVVVISVAVSVLAIRVVVRVSVLAIVVVIVVVVGVVVNGSGGARGASLVVSVSVVVWTDGLERGLGDIGLGFVRIRCRRGRLRSFRNVGLRGAHRFGGQRQ